MLILPTNFATGEIWSVASLRATPDLIIQSQLLMKIEHSVDEYRASCWGLIKSILLMIIIIQRPVEMNIEHPVEMNIESPVDDEFRASC